MKIVFPSFLVSYFKYRMMIREVKESSPEVGSSNITTDGSLISSKAIEVLFLSPPDTPFRRCPPTTTSRHFSSLNYRTKSLIRIFLSSSLMFNFKFAASSRVYRTVKVSIRISCCIT